jgi:flagellar biosynthesis protein FlhF
MKVFSFTADSAADAVTQIRAQLGAEAVVLHVRQLPAEGLSRLWQKPRIEVLACLPEEKIQQKDPIAELRQEIAELKHQRPLVSEPVSPGADPGPARGSPSKIESKWRVGSVLEEMGILPSHLNTIIEALQIRCGDNPPESPAKELGLMRSIMAEFWRSPNTQASASPFHIFVGAAGAGKTTILSKWLTQSVLLEGKSASVWRLDGQTANTAESLDVYGEILGVEVERTWSMQEAHTRSEICFVDLPGVDWTDASAVERLKQQITSLPESQVHVVLNAAYEVPLLFAQIRAFAPLAPADLCFTHLDEEKRWGKLWNFVLGTNYSIRFLSAGQNIPGNFQEASSDKLFISQLSAG